MDRGIWEISVPYFNCKPKTALRKLSKKKQAGLKKQGGTGGYLCEKANIIKC